MQLLNMPINLPVYLPADQAVVPFGDPLSDATVTSSTTAVVAAAGYDNPTVNDIVAFSSTSATPGGITAMALYYVKAVISTANGTFSISTAKGGAAVATTDTGTGVLTLHLLSMQKYGTPTPFKSGATALAINLTASDITLKGASDSNTTTFGNPTGPGSYSVIATVKSGTMALVQLNYDWILGSGTTVLSLVQN